MLEEHTEHPEPAFSLSAAHDHTSKPDRYAVLSTESLDATYVGGSIVTREMTYAAATDKHLDSVPVVRIVGLRDELGDDLAADSLRGVPSRLLPQVVLVIGLAHNLKRRMPSEDMNGLRYLPGGRLRSRLLPEEACEQAHELADHRIDHGGSAHTR